MFVIPETFQGLESAPPSPTSIDDIPPQNSPANQVIAQTQLKDVNADPLYAYVEVKSGVWHNYDRRDLVLSAKGNWRLIAAATITPQTPFNQEFVIEEGVASTETEERTFATEVGVNASVPSLGLGASISTSISEKIGRSITISERRTETQTLKAMTTNPRAVFWFWQLDVEYLITGRRITWEVTNNDGIKQLTGSDSRSVLTRDGPGRERKNNSQVKGAKRVGQSPISTPLEVDGTIVVVTQFPVKAGIDVTITDGNGAPRPVPTFNELFESVRQAA